MSVKWIKEWLYVIGYHLTAPYEIVLWWKRHRFRCPWCGDRYRAWHSCRVNIDP